MRIPRPGSRISSGQTSRAPISRPQARWPPRPQATSTRFPCSRTRKTPMRRPSLCLAQTTGASPVPRFPAPVFRGPVRWRAPRSTTLSPRSTILVQPAHNPWLRTQTQNQNQRAKTGSQHQLAPAAHHRPVPPPIPIPVPPPPPALSAATPSPDEPPPSSSHHRPRPACASGNTCMPSPSSRTSHVALAHNRTWHM